MVKQILTHPGSAHKDDFLAASLFLAFHPVPVCRREPSEADLTDPKTVVVDVGYQHDPHRMNFDHHQFGRESEPQCALSLALKHFELYQDARKFCEWLEPAEWFDCRGAIETAKWLNVPRPVINQLNSPIDVTLLRRFSANSELNPGDALWEVMRLIGEDLRAYVEGMRNQIDWLQQHAETWQLESGEILFIARTDPLPDDPRSGVGFFLKETQREAVTLGVVYPDRRGTGYGLSRYEDHQALDFTRIQHEPDVHFAHARGFLAKTSAREVDRLRLLVKKALIQK